MGTDGRMENCRLHIPLLCFTVAKKKNTLFGGKTHRLKLSNIDNDIETLDDTVTSPLNDEEGREVSID